MFCFLSKPTDCYGGLCRILLADVTLAVWRVSSAEAMDRPWHGRKPISDHLVLIHEVQL